MSLIAAPRIIASSSKPLQSALRPSRVARVRTPIVVDRLRPPRRTFATEAKFDPASIEREKDEVDVCIVGGGPAGLSAAIRLKQLEAERGGEELRVVVLEKGAEVGEPELRGSIYTY